MQSGSMEKFLKEVDANVKTVHAQEEKNDQKQKPKELTKSSVSIDPVYMSSPTSGLLFLGVRLITAPPAEFLSYTPVPPTTNTRWYIQHYPDLTSVIFSEDSAGYHWHFDGEKVVLKETNNDASFALDNRNHFYINGGNNPYTIKPKLAANKHVEYVPNGNNPSTHLPLVLIQNNYTQIIINDF